MNSTPQNNETITKHLFGLVIQGDGRGTKIGFPTANLKLSKRHKKPDDGVYACLAQILPNKHIYNAVLHVGPRPTFKGVTNTIEAHLLDFPHKELYGSKIKIFSLLYVRQIKKLTSIEELKLTIIQDINKARQLLSNKT